MTAAYELRQYMTDVALGLRAKAAEKRQSQAATPPLERYCPHIPTQKQTEFLALDTLEALYGGAARGGKTDALLMAALQYVDVPGYAALILRRTYADLALPDAIMDRADNWLRTTDARWTEKDKTWTFPSGATLTFGYLEHPNDRFRYQGAALQFCGFDELTQFSEVGYQYLFSRLTRLRESTVPLRMRAATNPGGVGHDWVKRRFIGPDARAPFVPARLADNEYVDQVAYREALAKLDDVTRAQPEEGDWDVTLSGAVFDPTWFADSFVDAAPANATRIRYWERQVPLPVAYAWHKPPTAVISSRT